MKLLHQLIEGAPSIQIEHLSQDSRDITPNTIFFCVKGLRFDGHAYINDVVSKGAVCIVHSDDLEEKLENVVYVQVDDVVGMMNEVASKYYDEVSKKMDVIGVTGTNGKSTTSYLCHQLVNHLHKSCGYMGTICIEYNGEKYPCPYTTPETVFLHNTLHQMYEAGVRALSMEVSSQGLEWRRCDSIDFDVAIYTNLSHDHLDVHGTMDKYLSAKKRLFENLKKEATAIINIDDSYYQEIVDICPCKVRTYSLYQEEADYLAKDITMSISCTSFTLVHDHKEYAIKTNLLAMFNVSNLVAAIAAVHSLGYPLEEIVKYVSDFEQVGGRMDKIDEGQPFNVIVDYAHSPDSLLRIFEFARNTFSLNSQLIAVFGSAGHRDAIKRPAMGQAADKYCDLIILTAEDPREEDPKEIANQIKEGITKHRVVFIENRETAIQQAIEMASPNDTVLILGKGREDSMAMKDGTEYYVGDHVVARNALKSLMNGESESEY
ncbi:MAG: UDP-N-acetylmuramoyl-L-alanyl-D-glutamate--2,6-diaminopimelate ligase [Erysipelotrichales bacterium]|nr:UDP-N-acetylmuramoyl-L-alanyl-D-glutamate--2,6-diaminopimelate ligase [Erysipelotrichales bacterium]